MHADLARLVARPIAHRGLHACGRPGPVENSIGAALAAVAAGFGIECDVQLSRDGEAMVFHDEELARLTGVAGRFGDRDAAELCRLRLGGSDDRVPCLADLLAAIDGRVPLVIEIKSAGGDDLRLTDRTLALLAGYRGAAVVESFDPAVIARCRALRAGRPVGLVGPPDDAGPVDAAAVAASDFLSWSIRDVAQAARRYPDLPLTSWTVRNPDQQALARASKAQIVFEGFVPSPGVNDATKEENRLSL